MGVPVVVIRFLSLVQFPLVRSPACCSPILLLGISVVAFILSVQVVVFISLLFYGCVAMVVGIGMRALWGCIVVVGMLWGEFGEWWVVGLDYVLVVGVDVGVLVLMEVVGLVGVVSGVAPGA